MAALFELCIWMFITETVLQDEKIKVMVEEISITALGLAFWQFFTK